MVDERAGNQHPGGIALVGNDSRGRRSGGSSVLGKRDTGKTRDTEQAECSDCQSRAGWTFKRHLFYS